MSDETITIASRTIAHLADSFETPKQIATRIRQSFGARQRGYFTLREDD